MRDELNLMELVDRYLSGELNTTERVAFEERLRTNAELRDMVEDQTVLLGGLQRLALRPAINKAYRNYKWGKWAPGVGGAVVIAILAVGGWMLADQSDGMERSAASTALNSQQELVVLPDTVGTRLPALVMTIDPQADTTLITPNGLVLDIPKGAFVDNHGRAITKPVRVTMQEAINGVDIMMAGLSTMAGDTLLETGGMFYIDAQLNGERVGIDPNKPLTVMVPSDNAHPGMMLYEGVMTEEGIVDWRNPKPLARTLVPVDISTLDFYPPGYLDKLAELGKDAGDKRYTDSLYWSFSAEHARYASRKEDTYQQDIWGPDTLKSNSSISRSVGAIPEFVDGAFLFATNCASCHKPYLDMVGPALTGARQRWHGKGDIYAWVKNSQALIKAGNPYANQLFRKWNKSIMTPQDLSDEDIDKIFNYVEMSIWPVYQHLGIDPAKIRAIWNDRFNGTNLATREFEERMWAIHRTCDNAVLDLYANNLEKNLSHLDSMAVRMGHGAFATFAMRNDGKVELPEHAAERLRKVYSDWSEQYADAARKTQEEFYKMEAEADQQANTRQVDRQMNDLQQDNERFSREFNANLRSAYEQLGYPLPPPTPPRAAFVVLVTNTGWWNVDKAVLASTTTRTSMSYTDDQTGKTATLTYTPVAIEVADQESFEALRVYLIPKELNSYQRVVEKDGAFTESLNSLFEYDVICIGRKDGQQYAASRQSINGGTNVSISLAPSSAEELRRMLRTPQANKFMIDDLVEQSRHLEWLEREVKRQKAKQAKFELRNALMPVVFPCAGELNIGEPGIDLQ